MSRPIVKVCGVTSEQEVHELARAKVDFFGLQVEVASRWAVSRPRAAELAALAVAPLRATLVTSPCSPEQLAALIRETGVRAVQLPLTTSPDQVQALRCVFPHEELVILKEVSYSNGHFAGEELIDETLAAGADYILLDKLEKSAKSGSSAQGTIPHEDLIAFRARHARRPILVAGGISAENARACLSAGGGVGIDVCSSVRREGLIQADLVAALVDAVASRSGPPTPVSLRAYLKSLPASNHVIGYLTIGDPPGRFIEVANEVLAAGAVTLELGFPYSNPTEGATLTASHERALAAGVDIPQALLMFRQVADAHPLTPLIALVQWSSIKSEKVLGESIAGLADAGAAAILPVGLPLWQLPALAESLETRGLQIVLPCPPDASPKYRSIALRYCNGALYVPRGRVTGGLGEFAAIGDFCDRVAAESKVPMVVGVGVKTAADVAEICRTKAVAAAVGSALVEHVARGGSAGAFVRQLTSG